MNGAKTYLCSAVEGWTVWYRLRNLDDFSLPDHSPVGFLSSQVCQNGWVRVKYRMSSPLCRKNSTTPPHGNCFYEAVTCICRKMNIRLGNGHPAPVNHADLRQAVCNTLEKHPQSQEWTQKLFRNKKRDWNNLIRNNRIPGTYTDNNGIMVVATAQYLGVILKIVPTSGDSRTPFYCIPDDVIDPETDGRPIVWIGLHQDDTDRCYDGKAGHYQSLELNP